MAEVKRIQLRGISRAPSDRLTEDGGVAESIDAFIDNTEVAAMPPGKSVTDEYLKNAGEEDIYHVFFHDVGDVKNCLYLRGTVTGSALVLAGNNKKIVHYFDNRVKELKSLGNTLIAMSDEKGQEFLLWQNGSYRYLGNQIPVPHLQVKTKPYPANDTFTRIPLLQNSTQHNIWTALNVDAWNTAAKNNNAQMSEVADSVWAEIQKKKTSYASRGYFTNPVLIRTAVKLRSGGYVHQSVPILVGAGEENFMTCEGEKAIKDAATGTADNYLKVKLNNIFNATGYFADYQAEEWSDIVESVDVFMSEDICYPLLNARFSTLSTTSSGIYAVNYLVDFDRGDKTAYEAIEQEVLSKAVFSKIASYPIASLQKSIEVKLVPKSQEELALADKMPEYDGNSNLVKLESVYNLNNRLLGEGKEEVLTTGYGFLPSTAVTLKKYITRDRINMFAYHVSGSDGITHKVIGKTSTGGSKFAPYTVTLADDLGTSTVYCGMYGFVFFPDANCYLCEVWDTSGDVIEIPMKPHPFLNCSYGYWGMGTELEEADLRGAADVTESLFLSGENRAVSKLRTLYLSDYANPFALRAANKLSFNSQIKAITPAALPMSVGQFGQYPVYVFCEDSIWSLKLNNDGTIAGKDLVSADSCLGPVCPIEQGVVFLSPEGVMLLEGQRRVCLSENLNAYVSGGTYEGVDRILEKVEWPQVEGNKFSYAHLVHKGTKIGYDYASKCLFFTNGSHAAVYNMKTETWHTTRMVGESEYLEFLNAFPKLIYRAEYNMKEWWYVCIPEGRLPADANKANQTLSNVFGDLYIQLPAERKSAIMKGKDYILLKGWTAQQIETAERAAEGGGVYLNEALVEIYSNALYEVRNPKTYDGDGMLVTIVTRPLDLGHPDVFKSISDIRVRGRYSKGSVRYILEGSNDGKEFHVLNSLRGRSWKLFRITLLAELTGDERISWIDVMYETRFTNRLR